MALAAQNPASGYLNLRPGIRDLMGRGQYKVALSQLLSMPSSEVEWLDDAATCYFQLGDGQTALKLQEMVTRDLPRSAEAWNKLGAMRTSLGDKKGAQTAFSNALKLQPKSVGTLCSLNRIAPFRRTSQRTRLLRRLALAKQTGRADRINAWNALGRIEEAAGQHREAFRYFQRSKALANVIHDRSVLDRHLDDQRRIFDGSRPSLAPDAGQPRIIFVCGMPRSGTTLMESILCRHPQVGTIGEAPFLMESFSMLRAQVQRSHGEASDWGWYRLASEDQLRDVRAAYLARVPAGFGGEVPPVIVDKLPLNALILGFARLIFGDATFVHLSRHPLDVGLSNFSTHFATAQTFSHDLADLGHMIKTVEGSVLQYTEVSGAGLRRQSYRRLVEAPEQEIPDLLEHVGLEWHAGCLAPEALDGAVRTASINQVRAPINTNALGRWRSFEAELAPLIDALGGPEAIAAWEARDCGEAGL